MSANDIYNKEIEFYTKIAPKVNQTLERLNETDQLIPEPYGVCIENNAILFEDLSSKGYSIASVHRGFNFDEAKIVLKKAATLHSVHAVLQQEDPNIFENFKYGENFKYERNYFKFFEEREKYYFYWKIKIHFP